jgi:ubiquinone/menaquinone biosynthesis C-methylase UbiE
VSDDTDADAFKAFEAAGWSANADRYDRLTGRVSASVVEPLLDAAEVGRDTRVLDLGTGPGTTAAVAAGRGARPVGVDLAEGMVELARRLHPELEFVQGDAEALPFPDGRFDAAIAAFVVNHLPHPERAAAELHRVLVLGGRVALAVWDVPERVGILGPLAEALRAADAWAPDALPVGPDPYRFADDEEIRRLLARAGFAAATVETVSFTHRVTDADELWDGILSGSVRTAARIHALEPGVRDRARAALEEAVAPYKDAAGLSLPISVKLGRATRPGSPPGRA